MVSIVVFEIHVSDTLCVSFELFSHMAPRPLFDVVFNYVLRLGRMSDRSCNRFDDVEALVDMEKNIYIYVKHVEPVGLCKAPPLFSGQRHRNRSQH